jgi:hypothetical protein
MIGLAGVHGLAVAWEADPCRADLLRLPGAGTV